MVVSRRRRVLLGIGALGATATTTSRHALLDQLQRAAVAGQATARIGFRATRGAAPSRLLVLAVEPNRAGVPNRVSVRLIDHGRPVSGARVAISFPMPSMGMWNAYTAVLVPAGSGRYSATVPVLGMAGRWQLRTDVAIRRGKTSQITVTDRLGA